MAESAVSFLVEKLTSLLGEEANLLSGIREEVAFVKDELRSMKAFIQKADAVEDEDPEIKEWVTQVREVAYDSEDIIDEFLYRFEHPRRKGFYGRLCKLARTIKTLKERHRIASELKTIKSKVTDISQRRERYRGLPNYVMERGSTSSSATDIARHELRRNDARLLHESQLVGIERPKEELMSRLLEDAVSDSQVVAVVGMGGLGKTTLVNQVYKDAVVKQRFQHRAWITVSQSYNLHDLLVKIIEQLFEGIGQPVPDATKSKDVLSLKEDIIGFLGDTKYLVVLDDLWSLESWEDLKTAFPANNNRGSRLMVTTRDVDVASTTTRDIFRGNIYTLESLSPQESWNLFCARTFSGNPCPSHLEEVSKVILKKCMGLPLAIVTIGGMLATTDTSKLNEWELVRRCLGDELNNNDKLKNVKKILSLSFNDLSYQLKSCFLFLSLFPEDWIFSKEYIINIWVAQDLVEEKENKTREEVGEVFFNELCNRNLIQLATKGARERFSRFRVHDLVREIILQKSKDQNFSAIASDQNPILFESVRHLSVFTNLENLKGDQSNISRLRTLLFLNAEGCVSRFSLSDFFSKYGGLRLLKVLDGTGLPLDTFPDCITKLYGLRYLSLFGTKVASLPCSIGGLQCLEMLELGETLIEELPVQILQLRRLRWIRVFRSMIDGSMFSKVIGASVPTGIGKLTSLQSLFMIKASHGCVDLMRSLGNLLQLRKLQIQQLGGEHGAALCSSIEKLSHLRSLRMETREEADVLDVQNISSPPQCLQELDLFGRLEMLPQWVPKLSSLTLLTLRWSKLELDPLESLQALRSLQYLLLDKAYEGEELCVKAGSFQMLKKLAFGSLGRLRKVTIEQGAMPHLQELWLEDCKSLEKVPSGVEFLTHLRRIDFVNMGDELLAKLHSSTPNPDLSRVVKFKCNMLAAIGGQEKLYSTLLFYGFFFCLFFFFSRLVL